MLAAKNLLQALESAEHHQKMETKTEKKEQELEKVLEFCFGNAMPKHDRKIRRFSFEH